MKKLTIEKKKDYLFALSIFIIPIISFTIFWLLININSIFLAFKKYDAEGVMHFAGLDNFINVIKSFGENGSVLLISLKHSLINYGVGLVCFAMCLLFSFYIFKKFFLHGFIRIVVMLPSIISSFILCLVVKKFIENGIPQIAAMKFNNPRFPQLLTNDKYAYLTTLTYSIWLCFTGYCIIIPNAMNSIDPEIIESAELDGVNLLQEFSYIVVPLIYPTISTYLITGIAGILVGSGPLMEFYVFDAPLSTYNMGYYLTVKTMTANTPSAQNIVYPEISAMGLLFTIITCAITFTVKPILDKYDYTEEKQ